MMALRALLRARLAGAALALLAVTTGFVAAEQAATFTPHVGPLMDIIIGDQTPLNNLSPGDVTTASDTLEGQSPSANIFNFPNAINIFDLVSDEPSLPGFTSDEDLIYEFVATPVLPPTGPGGAGSDSRISINGTVITPTGTLLSLTEETASLDFADVEFSGKPDPLSTVGTLTYFFGEGFHPTNITPAVSVTRDLIDANAITLRVTNQQANSASDDFLVYTVNDGPDALSRNLLVERQVVDLSGWVYDGAGSAPHLAGAPSFPGDTTVTGTLQLDDDGDASVVDLNIDIPGTEGWSFVSFVAPGSLIPFVQDGTYRVSWKVSRSGTFASEVAVPAVRFRHGYGPFGDLGNGYLSLANVVATPTTTGRVFTQFFDQLDVASANGEFTSTDPPTPENSIQLFFETIDIDSDVGGGSIELDSVTIDRLDRPTLLAQGAIERSIDNFSSSNPQIGLTGGLQSTNGVPIRISQSPDHATITAAFAQGASTFVGHYGFALTINTFGLGSVPFKPSTTSGRFYRARFGLDASASTAETPLPMIMLAVATFNPGQRLTTVENLMARRSALLGRGANPGLGAREFTTYLALPEGTSLGDASGDPPRGLGDQIGASVWLADSLDSDGGTLIIDSMSITSYPESILP